MKCETVDELLLDYLEGALETAEQQAVRAHVDACDACRRAVRETREMLDAMDLARRRQEHVFKEGTRASSLSNSASSINRSIFAAGKHLGDFEILEELGRGGMGVVYRARQVSLNRIVALKVLPGTVCTSEAAVNRFRHEAQAAAKLHHTNIVPVYAQGEADGHFYYAMELIEGPNLGHMLKEDRSAVLSGLHADHFSRAEVNGASSGVGPQPQSISFDQSSVRHRPNYRRIARLIASVADGLDHAHKANVIHRDIKPQNLLLGRDGQLHITDFGLARMLDEPSLTITGEMLGTPAYMSPEQIDADRERIDLRTDVYSLGVTLYELLTGKRPFDGVSREQLIARIREREPKALRRIDPQIPIDLETICLRAMEKAPPKRYPSAGEFAADLRRYADNRPILSRRTSLFEKGVKWVKRHPAKFTIGCLLVLMAVGAVAWSVQARANLQQRQGQAIDSAWTELLRTDYRNWGRARELLPAQAPTRIDLRVAFERTLGLSYVLQDIEQARVHVQRALDLDAGDLESLYLMAWIARRSGDDGASELWLAKGNDRLAQIQLDDDTEPTPEAYFLRATALVRSEPKKAMADYATAQNLALNQGETFYQAILHQGRAGNYLMFHERNIENLGQITPSLEAACTLARNNPYPRYLSSLAYRIAAEINADLGLAQQGINYFDRSLMMAREAQEKGELPGEDGGLRGLSAEAEFWESVSDRQQTLGRLFENLSINPRPWHVEEATGLRKALALRTRALSMCKSDRDRIEQYEYRWLVYYWLGDLSEATNDIDALNAIIDQNDWRKIWVADLVPALLAVEQQGPSQALERLDASDRSALKDERNLLALAATYHLIGAGDRASELLAPHLRELDTTLLSEWDRRRWRLFTDPTFSIDDHWPGFGEAPKLKRAEPLFIAGCVALGREDRSAAIELLQRCEACYDYEYYGYLARMIRRRLVLDAAWPPWLAAGQP